MKRIALFLLSGLLLPLAAFAQQKIGIVNTQEIIASMPDVKTAEGRIQELDKKYSAELQTMQDEYQRKAEAYIKEQPKLSEAISKSRQQELVDLQNRIQQSAQAMQQDMERQQQTLMAPIQQKVLDAIKKVGDENGFAYICESGVMLYTGSSAQNITAQVKAKLGLK